MRKCKCLTGIVAGLAPALLTASAAASVDIFPVSGSHLASPGTQISLRGTSPARLGTITVTGSRSGRHGFVVKAHSDGQGASLLPRRRFRPGELVTVRASGLSLTGEQSGAVRFRIARFVRLKRIYIPKPAGRPPGIRRVHSDHSLMPPRLVVRKHSGSPGPDAIFVGPKKGPGQSGPMITDGSGRLIWFHPLRTGQGVFDFRTQRYRSQPVLTWWQGRVFLPGEGAGEAMIYDSAYRRVARVRAGNGFVTDLHEFDLTPRSTALIVAYQPVQWHGGVAIDGIVQEVDVPTGLVVFEWHSLDRVAASESTFRSRPHVPFDYFHVNSAQLQPDGTLLVSARNTGTVYDIDHHTGRILWRLGGKHSDFKMGPGADFVAQHDARRAANGTISMFDNGSPPVTQRPARGILLALNMAAKTATLVREFAHSPRFRSGNQGSFQPLSDGGGFLDWGGGHSWVSQYDAHGHLVIDAQLEPSADDSYRAYRLPWSARPAPPPRVAASASGNDTIVFASWNGATGVAAWRVLAGDKRRALKPATVAASTGFESRIVIRGAPRIVRVQALAATGHVLQGSASARVQGRS